MKLRVCKNFQCKGLLPFGVYSLQHRNAMITLPDNNPEARQLAAQLTKDGFVSDGTKHKRKLPLTSQKTPPPPKPKTDFPQISETKTDEK